MLNVINQLVFKFGSDQKRFFGMETKWKNIFDLIKIGTLSSGVYILELVNLSFCAGVTKNHTVCALWHFYFIHSSHLFWFDFFPVCHLFDPQSRLQSGNCTTLNVPAVCLLEWEVLITQGCWKPYPWGYTVVCEDYHHLVNCRLFWGTVRRNLLPIYFLNKEEISAMETFWYNIRA